MNKVIVSTILLAAVISLVVGTSQTIYAKDNCPIQNDKVVCVFNIKKGDLEAKSLTVGPFNINSGNGGGTTQPFNDSALVAKNEQQDQLIANLSSENAALKARADSFEAQNSALAANVVTLTQKVATLEANAITDINLTNQSGSEVTPVPPVNNTGGNTNTTNPVPPNDNGTSNTNSTGSGNETSTTGNSTEVTNSTGTNSTGFNNTATIAGYPHITFIHTRGK